MMYTYISASWCYISFPVSAAVCIQQVLCQAVHSPIGSVLYICKPADYFRLQSSRELDSTVTMATPQIPSLQYYSNKLLWLGQPSEVTVFDVRCHSQAKFAVNVSTELTGFTVSYHRKQHRPGKLGKYQLEYFSIS